ncbi:MAG: putative bifunctional diguanylate cyclase/phosphodiesterase [Acidimicrobiia bacterium]
MPHDDATNNRARARTLISLCLLVTVATNVLYAASLFTVPRPESGYVPLWDGWIYTAASLAPALLVMARLGCYRRQRAAWVLVTAGICFNAVANLVYTYHDQNLDPIPFPALSDLPYLASYVSFAVALILITQRLGETPSRAVRLDGLIVGLAGGAVTVALWFEHILGQSGDIAAVLVGLAYPLFDVVFVVIVIAGLVPARFRPTWASGLFMAGIAIFAVGDIVYLNQVAGDTYRSGTPLEATWSIGIAAFAIASIVPERQRATLEWRRAPGAVLPTVAAVSALGVLGVATYRSVPPLASWLAMAAITVALARVAFTVRELRQANDAFRQARTDELTQLPNRRSFLEHLDRALGDGRTEVSVIVIDLNGFKEVNDSLGHHAGDQLLAVVGARFLRSVSDGDLVARLGGDEFGVIVSGPRDRAVEAASAISRTLRQPIAIDNMSVRVGAAIGISHSEPDVRNRVELVRRADVAMYESKAGQQGAVWYSPDQDPHSRDRLALIEDLRTAIDTRSFAMHYQPTIDVASRRVVGMEALIRWNHPTRGLLMPDEFIPLAERVGLVPAITRAVLELSITHLSAMRRNGHDLNLSVNISAMDLVSEDLPAYVEGLLVVHSVPAPALTLEITETAVSSDTARAERVLHQLRRLGVRISIDDFGVGYSSMSQLLKLPIDELKLDRSFISQLDTDVRARAVLSATVELGRTLGLDIVAEGIESAGAFDEVTERSVDIAQGFYFSKALPAEAFVEYVDEHPSAQRAAESESAG